MVNGVFFNGQNNIFPNRFDKGSYYPYKLLKSPPTQPITLVEVKNQLRISLSDVSQDTYLTSLIKSVVKYAEGITGKDFITKNYITYRDFFSNPFLIRKVELQKIDSIQYLVSDVLTTWASSNYFFIIDADYWSQIFIAEDGSFPTDADSRLQSIQVKLWAGMGIEVDTAIRATNVVTITTIADHNFSTGDSIVIAGGTTFSLNGKFTITVTGDKTFTYASSGSDGTAAGDFISANRIPDDLVQALLQHITKIYTHRGDCDAAKIFAGSNLPAESKQIYDLYKVIEVSI